MNRLSKNNPRDLVLRALIIDEIRSIVPVDLIREVDEEFVEVYEELDEDNVSTEVVRLNLEFLVFDAHLTRLLKLLEKFEPENKSQIIVPEKKIIV